MSVTALKEDKPFGYAGGFVPGENTEKDAETLGSPFRKYSRIGPAIGVSADSDSDKVDIGRQIELEADAAIKYRTCSWQKVGSFTPSGAQMLIPMPYIVDIGYTRTRSVYMSGHESMHEILIRFADCGSALLRVYLLGDHVLSIFLFGPWLGAWPHPDSRAGGVRALHVVDCLVQSRRIPS